MRLTSVRATSFLALPRFELTDLGDLTCLVGPNNSGKSSVLATTRLAKEALETCADGLDVSRLDRYWARTAREGGPVFEVRVGIELDLECEQDVLDAFLVAAWLPLLDWRSGEPAALSAAVTKSLGPRPARPMFNGEMVVAFDRRHASRWLVAWEFDLNGAKAHVCLAGPNAGSISPGPASLEPSPVQSAVLIANATSDLAHRVEKGQIPVALNEVLVGQRFPFAVARSQSHRDPPPVATVEEFAGGWSQPAGQEVISFAQLMHLLVGRSLFVTPNHRGAARVEFTPDELIAAPDLSDGIMVGAELHRLKNGDASMRVQFERSREIFKQLTNDTVDCLSENHQYGGPPDTPSVLTTAIPVITRARTAGGSYDVPLEFAGAGAVEALHLALILAADQGCVLVDEPGVHLSITGQRRLLSLLRSRSSQTLLVTHNPGLVPANDQDDLARVVRLVQEPDQVKAYRATPNVGFSSTQALQMMSSAEFRSVLFAAGVVICEGSTDAALIGGWFDSEEVRGAGLATMDESNVVTLSADSESAIARMVELAEALGIPWTVLADGPALRPSGKFATALKRSGRNGLPASTVFVDVRADWRRCGVFTFAETFGDDGSKAGEIEAFMKRVDKSAWEQAASRSQSGKGSRVGTAFADLVDPPPEALDMWRSMVGHLGVDNGTPRVPMRNWPAAGSSNIGVLNDS